MRSRSAGSSAARLRAGSICSWSHSRRAASVIPMYSTPIEPQ